MKNVLKLFCPVLLLVALSTGIVSAQPVPKIATFDLGKVFTNYYKTKLAEVSINDRRNQILKDENGMMEDLQKGEAEYKGLLADANNQVLSQDERDKKKVAADAKLKDLQQTKAALDEYDQSAKQQLADQSQRLREKILAEIKDAVNAKAKTGGYSLIIDSTASSINATPIIFYNNGQADLTTELLKQLNAGAPIDVNAPATDASKTNNP